MDITREREPRLRIDEGEPFSIASARVDWEMESSYLRRITGLDGRSVPLRPGAQITLYTGPSVVFMGIVQPDGSVLDQLSADSPDDGEYVDF